MAELSIKRALFGYRRRDVEALVAERDAELELRAAEVRVHCTWISQLEALMEERDSELQVRAAEVRVHAERIVELEVIARRLTLELVRREQEVLTAHRELAKRDLAPSQGLGLLDSLARRVEELHAQARGQATRVRLAALRHAADLEATAVQSAAEETTVPGRAVEVPIREVPARSPTDDGGVETEAPFVGDRDSQNGSDTRLAGAVRIDVGPLADFAQLIRIEDAARKIDAATDISIERFSGGRATLAVNLREPVELLKELEERSDLEFKVRRAAAHELVLDVGSP